MIDNPDRRVLMAGAGWLTLAPKSTRASAAAQVTVGAVGIGDITAFGARPNGGSDASIALNAAFNAYSEDRTSPPGLAGWGIGTIIAPRGTWTHRSPVRFTDSQVGFTLRGEAPYATTHLFDITTGAALPFKTYVAAALSDFYLRNIASTAGESIGIGLDPAGGGGPMTIKRVAIDGFQTAIKIQGVKNGDKTLVEQVSFGTHVGFDNNRDKQAVGWAFLNCSGICPTTHFRLSGAGEVAINHYVGNVIGSFIELPESSGNAGGGNFPARVTISGTQLEYHGNAQRLLIDARQSAQLTDQGGTNADIVLREVSIVSGATPPDPERHVIIQVGGEREGSDAVRIKQEGGWIEGVIQHASVQQGALNRRWSFRDAVRAPQPRTVAWRGTGNHPLMEWRANENVPVDQYRGGQGFTGAIDAQKAFLWRHEGAALINTGIAAVAHGERFGNDATIAGFPAGATQLALAVYLDEPLGVGHDLEIRQFADALFQVPLGPMLTMPAGSTKGLHRVHDKWHILDDGRLFVRVTLPARQRAVRGAIVPFYFPYMGS